MTLKSTIWQFVPQAMRDAWARHVSAKAEREYSGRALPEVFTSIYEQGRWGTGETRYYSGPGSHEEAYVTPYVEAVAKFVDTLPSSVTAVDIGCGDFNVGSRVAPLFESYTGCDVVLAVVEENRARFGDKFLHCDATRDPIPSADVVIIREVLQHLSNADIAALLANLRNNTEFKHLIVTNSIYTGHDFSPNTDIVTGEWAMRSQRKSGVDLGAAPFSLQASEWRVLSEVASPSPDVVYRTTLYTF